MTKLLEEAKESYTLRVISVKEVKIQANSMEAYDSIVEALKDRNTEFHSYQKKQDRLFKAVLRNMHSSADLGLLREQIEEHGHSVINISNIRHRVTKAPLPMFFVDLKSDLNTKEIYKIEFLLNTKIRFKPPNKKREISQCSAVRSHQKLLFTTTKMCKMCKQPCNS